MPLVGTRGALSSRGLGMLNLGGGYWIGLLLGSNPSNGFAIAVDVFGNVYMAGNAGNGTTNNTQITKYNTSGVIQWQKN
jgi:hypothetical protein